MVVALKREIRLNRARIAPNGHITRQKLRLTATAARITKARIPSLIKNMGGYVFTTPIARQTIDDSNVPAGHRRQKTNTDEGIKNGITKMVTTRITYFKYPLQAGNVNLGEGILYRISCRKPNGQIQPQKILPPIRAARPMIPIASQGIICKEEKFTMTPSGQAKVAAGQEWQLKAGKQTERN